MAARTPSQTIGPFFHEGLRWLEGGKVGCAEGGERIVLSGRITDGGGDPVGDAMVETWQAAATAAASGNPHGLCRVETAKDGTFRIETTMPAGDAPAIDVAIFARGLLKALRTRVYLVAAERARTDPMLKALGDSPRLQTLIATQAGGGEFRWNVRLQGDGETVFFAA